jgi:hypothetical protein
VDYFQHLLSWWPKRNDPNVLFLLYEDMLDDLESAVRAVASFMGIEDEASITNAVKMSTFDFMKQSRDKFATNLLSSIGIKRWEYEKESDFNVLLLVLQQKGAK